MRNAFDSVRMIAEPEHENIDDVLDIRFGKGASGRNTVPFFQTAAAAASGRVLCGETGMPAHGGLPSVIRRICRSKTRPDQFFALTADGIESPFCEIMQIRPGQTEAGTEFRFRKAPFQNYPLALGHGQASARVSFLIHV